MTKILGQVPSIFDPNDFSVVPLDQIPLVAHTFDEFRMGRVFRVTVSVDNVGAIAAYDIKVISTILSRQGEVVSNQETNPIDLHVNEQAEVTFYLDCPSAGSYQLIVKTEHDGNLGYSIGKDIDSP